MIVGTTLFKMDGSPFNSPEFGRGGLAATFVINVTHIIGTPSVTVSVESRNSEDTTWTNNGSFSAITTAGVTNLDLSGLKEILRFEYVFDGADADTDGIHFLMMAPSWRPY